MLEDELTEGLRHLQVRENLLNLGKEIIRGVEFFLITV